MKIGNNPPRHESAKTSGGKSTGDSKPNSQQAKADSQQAATPTSGRYAGRMSQEEPDSEEIGKMAAYEQRAAASEARENANADAQSNDGSSGGNVEPSAAAETAQNDNVVIDRRMSADDLRVWKEKYSGVVSDDLIEKANQSRGRGAVEDLVAVVTESTQLGVDQIMAPKIREFIENPLGKSLGRLRAEVVAEGMGAPMGLVYAGHNAQAIASLAAGWQHMGGTNPGQITPGFVDMATRPGQGMSLNEAQQWAARIETINNGAPSAAQPGMIPGLGIGHASGTIEQSNPAVGSPNSPGTPQEGGASNQGPLRPEGGSSFSERGASRMGNSSGANQGGNANSNEPAQAEYTVTGAVSNPDGTAEYTFDRSGGDDGQDGSYKAVYDGSGSYDLWSADGSTYYGQYKGDPPKNVKPGDATTVVDGEQAVYETEPSESDDATTDDTDTGNDTDGSTGTGSTTGSGDTDATDGTDDDTDSATDESGDDGSSNDGESETDTSSENSVGTTPDPDNEGGGSIHIGFAPVTTPAQRGSSSGTDDECPDDPIDPTRFASGGVDFEAVRQSDQRTQAANSLLVNPVDGAAIPRPSGNAPSPGMVHDDGTINPTRES